MPRYLHYLEYLFIADIALFAAPFLIYLLFRLRSPEIKSTLFFIAIALLAIMYYCAPYRMDPKIRDSRVFQMLISSSFHIWLRVVLLLAHWLAWIWMVIKKADIRTQIFPHLVIWILLLVQGKFVSYPDIWIGAALYILAAALFYKSPEPQVSNPESTEVSAEK